MRLDRGEMQETVLFGFTRWRHARTAQHRTAPSHPATSAETPESCRPRRRAEHRTLQNPALGLHRRRLALAGEEAMVGLAIHPIVVETCDRNAIGRAVTIGLRRLRLEHESLEEPERARPHDVALDRVDR